MGVTRPLSAELHELRAEAIAAIEAGDAERGQLLARAVSILEDPDLNASLMSATEALRYEVAHWLREYPSDWTAMTLIGLIEDESQSLDIRDSAIESLGDCTQPSCREAVLQCLLRQLESPHPRLRFWAVWALGGRLGDPRAIPYIERLAGDTADEDCMWSVGREAQALIASHRGPEYESRLQAEMKALIDDPTAPNKERQWAASYWQGDWTTVEWRDSI